MIYLRNVSLIEEKREHLQFPFNLPILKNGLNLNFTTPVTIFVGENGTGKSTLMEALASGCGFNPSGGNKNHYYSYKNTESELFTALRFSFFPKTRMGFFMRAESFFNFSTYLDKLATEDISALDSYGGRSLHEQSHGEAFLALFQNHFREGIFILDEPEAALSPQRQLAFLSLIHDLEESGKVQFIIATHSPILLSYPTAKVLSLDSGDITEIDYRDCDHFKLTKNFINNPERYFRYLFEKN